MPLKAVAHCSFCARSKDEAGPFVEGPHQVYICRDCCKAASEDAEHLYHDICSFCCQALAKKGIAQNIVFESTTSDGVCICHECLELAYDIFSRESLRS